MKFCSRSTLGVVIGSLNILCYIIVSIMMIFGIVGLNVVAKKAAERDGSNPYGSLWDNRNNRDKEIEKDFIMAFGSTVLAIVLVLCLIMTVISGLLIMGIVKRRHTLMAPWLILSGIGFVLNCLHVVVNFFGSFSSNMSFGQAFLNFMGGCIVLGIQGLILHAIYSLYNDIQAKHNVRPGQNILNGDAGFVNDYNVQSNYNPYVPQKA